MVAISKYAAGMVVALAIAATASPSLAQSNGNHMTSAREQALHECNTAAAKYRQYTWGHQEIDTYRACMANHGQPE